MSGRTRKVESQLKEIVGEEVAALSDPRIRGLSALARADAEEAQAGLASAAGRLQAAVGTQTRLKRTPRLRFEPDPVVEQVARIESALREVRPVDDPHDE
jgi:ribosome-binding factor A